MIRKWRLRKPLSVKTEPKLGGADMNEFNPSMIGLLYESRYGSRGTLHFNVIVGYDYSSNLYLSKPLGRSTRDYSIVDKAELARIVHPSQAILLINEEISRKNEQIDIMNLKGIEIDEKSLRENYKNEYRKLLISYRQTYNQIKPLTDYINYFKRIDREKDIALYEKELRKIKKGLKRFDKRFYFFFKEEAEKVKNIVIENSFFEDIYYAKKGALDEIDRLEKQRTAIFSVLESRNFAEN